MQLSPPVPAVAVAEEVDLLERRSLEEAGEAAVSMEVRLLAEVVAGQLRQRSFSQPGRVELRGHCF